MFDEQPDGDPHGECAAEIHALQARLDITKSNEQTTHEANKRMAKELLEVEKQRDKLLAALIAFRDCGPNGGQNFEGWHESYRPAVEAARAVIAEIGRSKT